MNNSTILTEIIDMTNLTNLNISAEEVVKQSDNFVSGLTGWVVKQSGSFISDTNSKILYFLILAVLLFAVTKVANKILKIAAIIILAILIVAVIVSMFWSF